MGRGSDPDMQSANQPDLAAAIRALLTYCRENEWAGYDPYDALNSRLLKPHSFLDSRFPRLALTQFMKRSPVNLRRLALIPRTQNPKALALFLSSLFRLPDAIAGNREADIRYLIERLASSRSEGQRYSCWGYSFPWQGRSILVPAGAPNLVCTTFVAESLLDAYERRQDGQCAAMAVSAAEYILNELYWSDGTKSGFSYPMPGLRGETHNANLLAAALFCRVYRLTGQERFVAPALGVARQAVHKQRPDGSWYYGEHASQKWIDNFHTGYNLSALHSMGTLLGTAEFEENVRRGFEFYRAHFFRKDTAPKYFHDRNYPIDAHCVAQSILTLLEFQDRDPGNLELAQAVFDWAIRHMWDERGFFYYRRLRLCTIRTSYMRWTQAWMLLALATLFTQTEAAPREGKTVDASLVHAL